MQSDFLHSKDVKIRSAGYSKLPIGVNGCLIIFVSPGKDWQPDQNPKKL